MTKSIIKLLVFTASFLALGNCKKNSSLLKHDKLSIPLQDYDGTELRINGYYYTEANGSLFSPSFFFQNGVFINAGGSFEDINAMDSYINDEFISGTAYKDSRLFWGAFLIENESVKFEYWYPSSGGPFKAYVSEGLILNDTTFHITQVYRNQDGDKTDIDSEDDFYHFRKYDLKPDSVNCFIE